MWTPKDQLHDLVDHLENGLTQHGPSLNRNDAVDVLQRLIDLTVAHVDLLRKSFLITHFPQSRNAW